MIEQADVVAIFAGMVVALVAALALGIVMFRRTVQGLPAIREQWQEIYEQKADAIRRWNRWGCVAQFLYAGLVVLLLVNGGNAAFGLGVILLAFILPLLFIVGGLRILVLGYGEVRPVFRSLYFVTGGRAARRGKVMLGFGLLLLVPWLWFVVHILDELVLPGFHP